MSGRMLTNCTVCESSDLKFKCRTFDRHYLQYEKKYDLHMCNNCGLLFLNPMITEEELHNLYPKDDYYAYEEFSQPTEKQENKTIKKLKGWLINSNTKDPVFDHVNQRSVLDVGCGSGEKLQEFKQKGWKKVLGVEIDKHSCEIGKSRGIDIINSTLEDAKLESDSFDYIRSNHSFEHIINNKEVINEMYRICKPGGKLFIGVPNTKSLNYKFFGKYWYFLGVPFHPYGYNPKNLSILLSKSGFKVEKVVYNGSALGILGSFQIFFNSLFGIKHSKGILINKFFEVIFQQFAKIINFFSLGDCIEIIASKNEIK